MVGTEVAERCIELGRKLLRLLVCNTMKEWDVRNILPDQDKSVAG